MSGATLRLVLMRHAKSSWKSEAPSDHARPLNGRGRRAAPKVAAELSRRGWVPDLVVASDSARTRETWERMRRILGDVSALFCPDLYLAGTRALRLVLAALEGDCRTVLALGHNPGWEEALGWLTGHDEELKTADAALLRCASATWPRAVGTAEQWELYALVRARKL